MSDAPTAGPDAEITIRLSSEMLRAIDRFIESHDRKNGRQEVVLAALHDWAVRRGYMSEPGEEGIRPENLTSANDG